VRAFVSTPRLVTTNPSTFADGCAQLARTNVARLRLRKHFSIEIRSRPPRDDTVFVTRVARIFAATPNKISPFFLLLFFPFDTSRTRCEQRRQVLSRERRERTRRQECACDDVNAFSRLRQRFAATHPSSARPRVSFRKVTDADDRFRARDIPTRRRERRDVLVSGTHTIDLICRTR